MLLTKQQIEEYLYSANLINEYTCGDGTSCEMFTRRVLPNEVFAQRSLGENMPSRHWWIEYLPTDNKFILHCSYFDTKENPITREQFIELLKEHWSEEKINTLPAVLYTPEAVIEWIPTNDGEWTATYSIPTPTSGCMIVGPLSKIILIQ